MISFPRASSTQDLATLRAACEAKREYLSAHLADLYASTSSAQLWTSMIKYRQQSVTDDSAGESFSCGYSDLQLTYDGYHNMVYEILFHVTPEEDDASDSRTQEQRRQLYFGHPFLSPATFLAFTHASAETVPILSLYAFAAKRLLLFRLRVLLELVATAIPCTLRDPATRVLGRLLCPPCASCPLSNGLTQADIEAFIHELLPNLRLVRDVAPSMEKYYLCHASRKFMFMNDTYHIGALPIDTLMKSGVFSELLCMFENDPRDAVVTFCEGCQVDIAASLIFPDQPSDETVAAVVVHYEGEGNNLDDLYTVQTLGKDAGMIELTLQRSMLYCNGSTWEMLPSDDLNAANWFSLAFMWTVYDQFNSLDVDEDGVLTSDELLQYNNNSFTQLAITRVFECHVPHTGPHHVMSYDSFLNFVLATENAGTRAAGKYIWSVLDVEFTQTHISLPALRCFCKELASELVSNRLMVDITPQSILSEIVDMINPAWHEWVTFDDIERSGQQGMILTILLSYRNFHAYDCREQTAANANDGYTDTI